MDCSPPGSSVYGIFSARILEWVTISSSRESPPRFFWGSNPHLLHWQADSAPLNYLGSPRRCQYKLFKNSSAYLLFYPMDHQPICFLNGVSFSGSHAALGEDYFIQRGPFNLH